MNRATPPSMYDVASRAGVSHQTVSRVLNGFEGIRPETRDRVLEAIDAVGYRPNLAARSLATRRSHALGILAPATADFGPVSTVQAVERAARSRGYRPLTTTVTPEVHESLDALDFLLNQSVEALIVVAPYRPVLDALAQAQAKIPVIALQTGSGVDVGVDQVAGAAIAIQHLVAHGHRDIQLIAGPIDFLEATVRLEAARHQLATHGLSLFEPLNGDWSAASGYAAAARIDSRATAVFCANDQMAIGLIHGLHDIGLRVPDDISVIGFDDIPESAHSVPPLTTIHQDFAEVGRRAVEHVAAEIEGVDAAGWAAIRPWIVERSSVAVR